MDKAILKKFAIESRKELMSKIESKIKMFYIDEQFSKEQKGDVYVLSNEKHSLSLTREEYEKRELLIKRIKELSVEQVIEEAAYTWFNRIIAIRYMEINDMLPLTKDNQSLGIRVLSSKDNTPDPEILKFTNLMNPDLGIEFEKEKYIELKDDNKKFEYILLLVCKKLGQLIPQVFGGVTDYIDILIPDNLLNDTGFITKVITEVPDENYNQVEIIGWLYQYYISEKKEVVFDNLKKNIKVSKNDIPAATQLFTPDWIVKYMVDNTLGRYTALKEQLEYYVEDKDQTIIENKQLEEITFIDPCCGSGHILVYALELFYKAYMANGFVKEKAIENILTKNLYGIDLDERAVQLTILTLVLKAREYDKNIFNKSIIKNMNIISLMESNAINKETVEYYIREYENKEILSVALDSFKNASEYGSLIKCDKLNYESLLDEISRENFIGAEDVKKIVKQAIMLSNKYTIVCTNPPYMGRKSINSVLSEYLNEKYPKTKSEMYSAFIERCNDFTQENGYQAMITIHTWMFISSFENVRNLLLDNGTLINMLHTGPSTFTELSSFNVLATAFCLKKSRLNINTTFIRLVDYYNALEKIENFNNRNNYYYLPQSVLREIPGTPFIYWISDKLREAFKNNKTLKDFYPPKQGLATADNDRFLRLWYEVAIDKIGFGCKSKEDSVQTGKKWFPYNKGGDYRKWYGNNDCVIAFDTVNYNILANQGNHLPSRQYYFKKGITWSLFGFENFGVRYKDYGFVFDVSGSSMFPKEEDLYYVIGYLCSNVAFKFLSLLAPTVNFQVGNIADLPFKMIEDKTLINSLVEENIEICKEEWDSNETSWDFKKNPLINRTGKISEILEEYKDKYNKSMRNKLRNNEETLNKEYAKIFDVEEVDFSVNDRDLSLKELDDVTLIKKLLSYAVGCMFGRYSLDEEGLMYAGGAFDVDKYKTFKVDLDNVIPISDDAYFADDIVSRFKQFIEVVYGTETLQANLDFIAETLGKRGTETSEDTIRRYFNDDFYADHLKVYQKRPIYWLFDSGKKNGFKCLIYMHRYNENTIPKIRLDYLHRLQTTYENLLSDINYKLTTELSMADKKELQKKQADLNAKLQETKEYDEKIAHIANRRIMIDLDEGVKENYDKFKGILAKIK